MKKKVISIVLSCAMAVVMLSGCGSSAASNAGSASQTASEAGSAASEAGSAAASETTSAAGGKVLRLCLASEPDHLDPALNSSVDGACLASNSFVGLYTSDKDGNVVPALADSCDVSDDGLTYTFTLKDGLKWSDGTDLTAKDFEYSWKRAANPDTASDYSYLFAVFDGFADADGNQTGDINVKASDDGKTLTCVLTAPCPYFMSLVAFPVFMPVPQASVEAASDWETNPGSWASEAGFVTDGAFTLKEWKHNESMVYVKNPNYYDAANVSVDELDFMLSDDDTAILAAYQAGDLDYIDTVPNDEIETLKQSDEFKVADNLGTYYVGFNVNSKLFDGKTPEQAADMRLAFNYLIDRQTIVDNIAQTNQEVATSFIPDKMSDGHGGVFKTSDADYTYPDKDTNGYFANAVDVDKAVELLKSAGYKFDDQNMLDSSNPINITYLTNDGTAHVAIAQQIQQDLAAVGITMDIQQEDWQTFLNDRKEGNFDVAREGWLADYDDPINMIEMFTTDSGNNDMQLGKDPTASAPQNWADYDSLVDEIRKDTDLVDREAKLHKAEDMLMATGAVVPIYYYNDLYMQKANVDGIYSTVFGTKYFMYATIK